MKSVSQVEGTQGFLPQLKKDLEIPPSTCLYARFPCHNSRAMPRFPSLLEWRLTSLGPQDRLPEFPVVTLEKPHMSRRSLKKTTKLPRHHEMRPFFSARPRKQFRVLSQNFTGGLTQFRPLNGLQKIPVATREESGVLCFHSRRGVTLWVNLEFNPEIPVATGEEQ